MIMFNVEIPIGYRFVRFWHVQNGQYYIGENYSIEKWDCSVDSGCLYVIVRETAHPEPQIAKVEYEIPYGYEFVRFGLPNTGDYYITYPDRPPVEAFIPDTCGRIILRKL